MMKQIGEYAPVLKSSLGYTMISFFCSTCGFLLSYFHRKTNNSSNEFDFSSVVGSWNREIQYASILFFICIYVFLVAREISVETHSGSDSSENLSRTSKNGSFYGLCIIIGIIVLGAVASLSMLSSNGAVIQFLIFVTAALLPFLIILFRTNIFLNATEDHIRDIAFQFPNRIYFPALAVCFHSFLLGWFLLENSPFSNYLFLGISLAFCLLMYFSDSATYSSRRSVFVYSLLLITIPILSRIFSEVTMFVGVLFALFISFSLGVTEVTNRLYFIKRPESNYFVSPKESAEYYESGANWSAFVFIPTIPLIALFQPAIPVWLMYIFTIIFLVIWIAVDDKSTRKFRYVSLALGFFLPVFIIGGLFIGTNYQDFVVFFGSNDGLESSADLSDRITTILGVLLTIIFVLLQSDYKFLMKNFRKSGTFLDKKHCMLLFFVVVSLVSIYALFVTSVLNHLVGSRAVVAGKIDELQILSLALIATILVSYIWEGGNSDDPTDNVVAKSNSSKASTNEKNKIAGGSKSSLIKIAKPVMTWRLFELGRPLISAIAGSSTSIILFLGSQSEQMIVVASGLSIFFITMFGFVINDIFDLRKDMAGNRSDKLLVTGQVSLSSAKFIAFILLIISWCLGFFLGGFSSLQFLITLAISLTVYSPFSRNIPLLKGIYTAILCISPGLFVNQVADFEVISTSIFAFGILFFIGRELLIDAVDFSPDKAAGLKTLAIWLGKSEAVLVGWIVMTLAFVIQVSNTDGQSQVFAIIGLATILICWIYGKYNLRTASNLSRLPLVFGVISVALAL